MKKDSSKKQKFVVTKETIQSLAVKTQIKTGMRAVGGGACPSWPDASCATGQC